MSSLSYRPRYDPVRRRYSRGFAKPMLNPRPVSPISRCLVQVHIIYMSLSCFLLMRGMDDAGNVQAG
jgi:hypothetical protein